MLQSHATVAIGHNLWIGLCANHPAHDLRRASYSSGSCMPLSAAGPCLCCWGGPPDAASRATCMALSWARASVTVRTSAALSCLHTEGQGSGAEQAPL